MGRRYASLFACSTMFLLTVLAGGQVTAIVSAQVPDTVVSAWMTQPIIVDGKITTAEEWSDTVPVDLTSDSASTGVSARIWIKNDLKHFCMLATTKWPARDYDERDAFCVNFPSTWSEQLDVIVGGYTIDWNRVNKTRIEDIKMLPPGRNDVEGGACHNGTHYWFELRRKLDTGDPYDLVLVPGRAWRNFSFNFYDSSAKTGVGGWSFVLLFAPVLPSIGFVKPEDQTATSVFQVRFIASVLGHLSKVTLVMDGKDHEMKLNQAGLYEASLTLADGIYKWRVNTLGVLGNVSSIPERSLTVDTARPTVTIRSPISGEVVRSEVLVSWEALDATSGIAKVEVKIDASDWTDVTGKTSHTATWLAEGNHEVKVRATDKAGNVEEKIVTFTFLPSPWYVTYWYVPAMLVAVIAAIAIALISRSRPPKPPARPSETKPLQIERPPKRPTREQLLKELENLRRSGKITETAYNRLKKKYETEGNQSGLV